jgi:alkaline phosphatase D
MLFKKPQSQCIIKSREFYESVFRKTKDFPNYAKLRETTPVIGVWDDHDYGKDNAGSEFCGKDLIRELYLNFIDEPKDSERRL